MYQKMTPSREIVYFIYAPPMTELDDPDYRRLPKKGFSDANKWESSVFYYWWLFLRENEEYRLACENGGIGPKAELFRDFGDVYAKDFPTWWKKRGRDLFREPASEGVIHATSHCSEKNRIKILVPVTGDLERSLSEIRSLIQPIMQQYRIAVGPSQAKYPVATKPVLSSLHKLFLLHRSSKEHADLAGWQLYDLLPNASANQSKEAKASSVSRSLKQAKFLIDQVGNGIFPVMSEIQLAQAQHMIKTREKWTVDNFRPVLTAMRQRIADQGRKT
jgi:hypothetical protein